MRQYPQELGIVVYIYPSMVNWVYRLFIISLLLSFGINHTFAQDELDYLVVTTEDLKSGFEPLVEWKIRKGLNAEIITLEEIYSSYDEPTPQLEIKRFLFDTYTNRSLKWVLLGGDQSVVPVQRCFSRIIVNESEFVDNTVPTDLFYACFEKRFDWNSTLDDKIGEIIRDGHDLLPEIYISRIPVTDHAQVEVFVNKTLKYEKESPGASAGRMLLAGVRSSFNLEGRSDNHLRSEEMFNNYLAGKWSGETHNFFDTGTDFPGDLQFHVNVENLSSLLNSGYGIFHFAGPGNRTKLQMEFGESFSLDHASELSNPVPGVFLSTAGQLNAFDSLDICLGQALIGNPEGGAVAVFGNSRFGFVNPDTSLVLGPSFQYSASFMKYLFDDDPEHKWKSFAGIASRAKSDFTLNGASGGAFHYLLYSMNAMGDPELPVFTGVPSEFQNVRIYRMSNSLAVNTGGLSHCRICITSLDLNEGYMKVAEDVSFYTFEDIPDNYQVTITCPNYIPYVYVSGYNGNPEKEISSMARIYPNPVQDVLHLDLDLPRGQLQIIDVRGKLLAEKRVFHGSNSLSVAGYPGGHYILKILSEQGMHWFKFSIYEN